MTEQLTVEQRTAEIRERLDNKFAYLGDYEWADQYAADLTFLLEHLTAIRRDTVIARQNIINERLRRILTAVDEDWSLDEIRSALCSSINGILNDFPSVALEAARDEGEA